MIIIIYLISDYSIISKSTRDTRRQSRLVRGGKNGFQICTINHAKGGEERLDATITYDDSAKLESGVDVNILAHDSDDYDHDKFFSAYSKFLSVYIIIIIILVIIAFFYFLLKLSFNVSLLN